MNQYIFTLPDFSKASGYLVYLGGHNKGNALIKMKIISITGPMENFSKALFFLKLFLNAPASNK